MSPLCMVQQGFPVSLSIIQEVPWPHSFSLLLLNSKIMSLNFLLPQVLLSVGKFSKASIKVFRKDSIH